MTNKKRAVMEFFNHFSMVPGSLFAELAKFKPEILGYDTEELELFASPRSVPCCPICRSILPELEGVDFSGESQEESVICPSCQEDFLLRHVVERMGEPVHGFPTAHNSLFSPDSNLEEDWIRENLEKVAECGFFVFDSSHCGILLGIDGGGYSFLDDHFEPLYEVCGLQWHKEG